MDTGNQNLASKVKKLELQSYRGPRLNFPKGHQDKNLKVLRQLITFAVGTESSVREGNFALIYPPSNTSSDYMQILSYTSVPAVRGKTSNTIEKSILLSTLGIFFFTLLHLYIALCWISVDVLHFSQQGRKL